MRAQQLGPELMNPETVLAPLISASRLRSRWNVAPAALFLACRRPGPCTPSFGRSVSVPASYPDLSWRSVNLMRRLTVLLLLAGLLAGTYAVAADTPEAPAAKSSQGDPLVRALAAKGILTAQEAETLGALPAAQQRDELTALLLKKGVLTVADLKGNPSSNERLVGFMGESPAALKPAVLTTTEPGPQAAALPKPPAFIAAVAP